MSVEAMRNAVEAMDKRDYEMADHILCQAIAEADTQEPVAWADHGVLNWIADMQFKHASYLYPHPQPKREWVGLTDEEIGDLKGGYQSGRIGSFVELTQAIEAKLKEKNT